MDQLVQLFMLALKRKASSEWRAIYVWFQIWEFVHDKIVLIDEGVTSSEYKHDFNTPQTYHSEFELQTVLYMTTIPSTVNK